MTPQAVAPCPLCQTPQAPFWLRESRRRMPARDYHHCPDCGLIFVPAGFHLDATAERGEYELHRNDPADEGYRRYLGRILPPLLALLPPAAPGLDYGCGPAPVLQHLLQAAGHPCAIHDPYFHPDPAALQGPYAFITCTEVAEHFAAPAQEFERLASLLAPGGVLALMTRRPVPQEAFAQWHYSRDPTHIAFYSADCLAWIARHHKLTLQLHEPDMALLVKET